MLHELRFAQDFLTLPQGSGTSRQNSRDIPGLLLFETRIRWKIDKLSREWHELFVPTDPLAWKTPHPTGRSPDPKSYSLCDLFFRVACQEDSNLSLPKFVRNSCTKDFLFCNQVSNGNILLSPVPWSGALKNCSHCSFQDFHSLTKENQVWG